ncbi:metal-dependent transcriptional regulator [Clostridium phoceensis]|uniref:metal-dependent transcriptional regulator n=1 Tax=Clostridium phoceensis TaxID=1650661 RepID=UPI00067F1FA3|nr:metal-dependent transcriptional regulator [Clostridium phoceensis]
MEKKRSATASGEDYLEAVLVLQKEKGMVRSVDVARHMGVSKPSVCHAVAILKRGGFLTTDEDLFLRLTDIGRGVAEQTYEKHCFFTLLLMEAGVEPEIAEQEVCRIEHVISEDSFQKLANLYQRRPSNARSIEDEGEI